MKKQSLKISGRIVSLSKTFLEKNPDINQKKWNFEMRPGGWIIASRMVGEKNKEMERKKFFLHESKGKLSMNLAGHVWFGELQNILGERGEEAGIPHSDTIAQFPGKVRKILIKNGDLLQAGDILILMEAMKMEFTIRSPYKGKVKKLFVQEGQQISPGDIFLEIEREA